MNEKQEKLVMKKNVKKIILVVIICIVVLLTISMGIFISNRNKDVITLAKSEVENKFQVNAVFERNKQGFLVDKNDIVYENYDEKSNLISYSIKNGDKTNSDTLSYEYDDLSRVTKLTNNKGFYVKVAYISDTNKIEKIEYNIPGCNYIYNFTYSEDSDYPTILKEITLENGDTKKSGYITFKEVTLNAKVYVFSLETSENINSYEDNKFFAELNNTTVEELTKTKYTKKINLKKEDNNDNIFDILEIIPLAYFGGYAVNPQDISTKAIMIENNIISPKMSNIISNGPTIYEETKEKKQEEIYDKKDRRLHSDTQYYKYNDINDKEYEYTTLTYADSTSLYAYGMSEEDSKRYGGMEGKARVYLDDNGKVIKIETIGETQYLEKDIANEKLEEYKKYIENNKVDTSSVNFDNFQEEMNNKINEIAEKSLEENTRRRRKHNRKK